MLTGAGGGSLEAEEVGGFDEDLAAVVEQGTCSGECGVAGECGCEAMDCDVFSVTYGIVVHVVDSGNSGTRVA